MTVAVQIDALAQEIRRVDGENSLGAGALAEALMPFLAAQHRREAEAGAPDGWVLVPREPTEAMIAAGAGAVAADHGADLDPSAEADTSLAYRAMLAASPSSPALKTEPFCYVREWPAIFDPQNGGEPASVDFSDVPKPGYEPLFKASALGEHP